MTTHIEIDIQDNDILITEAGSTGEHYFADCNSIGELIESISTALRDYLNYESQFQATMEETDK